MSDRTLNRIGLGFIIALLLICAYTVGIKETMNYYETLACVEQGYDTAYVEGIYAFDYNVTCSKTTIEEMELK